MLFLLTFMFMYSQSCLNNDVNMIVNTHYSALSSSEKSEICNKIEDTYKSIGDSCFTARKNIVNYCFDSILYRDVHNSSKVSKFLLYNIRINEIDTLQEEKVLELCESGYSNWSFIELVGLIGKQKFIKPLKQLKLMRELNNFEANTVDNTLVILGDVRIINSKVNKINKLVEGKYKYLDSDFYTEIYKILLYDRKEFCELLLDLVENDNGKLVNIGDYGDGDILYCSLSTVSLEILTKIIKGFSKVNVTCFEGCVNEKVRTTVKEWRKNNNNYDLIKWHPYYGANYLYW